MPKKSRKGESANHLISFQFRAPQATTLSPALGPSSGGHAANRVAPRTPADLEKVKLAHRLQSFQYLVYPDVAACIAAATTAGQSGAACPTSGTGTAWRTPAAYALPNTTPQLGKTLAKAVLGYDTCLGWEYVYGVVMRSDDPDAFTCPICLETPCAPRVTPCGHVYCLPCILRFLRLQKEEDHQRTCPMCHAMVVPKQLKRVVFQLVAPYAVGQTRRLVLVNRFKESPLLYAHGDIHLVDAVAQGGPGAVVLPRYEEDGSAQFSRYSVATDDLHALHQLLDESALEERRRVLTSAMVLPMTCDDANELRAMEEAVVAVVQSSLEYFSTPGGGRQGSTSVAAAHVDAAASMDGATDGPRADPVVAPSAAMHELYMDADGQQVFLHFVCVKMLHDDCHARGVPMPSSVDVSVVDIEALTQSESTRTALKPLAHVPLFGRMQTVFADMHRGLVHKQTIDAFREVLGRRMQRIHERQNEAARRDANQSVQTVDDAWERHKAARRNADPQWRDAADISPTMRAFASPCVDDMPSLEQLPGATSGYRTGCEDTSSTEKTVSWSHSVGGPSDSSLETRQRATKGRSEEITDALTAVNLSCVGAAPDASGDVPAARPVSGGCWGTAEGSSGSARALLFATSSSVPHAKPTWGGKPFVDRSAKGALYQPPPQMPAAGNRGPPVARASLGDDHDDVDLSDSEHCNVEEDQRDAFERLQASLQQGGGRVVAGGGGGGKKKKGHKKGTTISLTSGGTPNTSAATKK